MIHVTNPLPNRRLLTKLVLEQRSRYPNIQSSHPTLGPSSRRLSTSKCFPGQVVLRTYFLYYREYISMRNRQLVTLVNR